MGELRGSTILGPGANQLPSLQGVHLLGVSAHPLSPRRPRVFEINPVEGPALGMDPSRSGSSLPGQKSLVGFFMAAPPLVVCDGVPFVDGSKIGPGPKAQACSLVECLLLEPGRLDGRSHLDLLAVYAPGVGSGLEAMD